MSAHVRSAEVRAGARRPVVVAVSGPDGAGKSTIVAALRTRLEAGGHEVVSVYTYGCVVCRRMPPSVRLTLAGGRPPRPGGGVPRILAAVNAIHALVDASELRLRLALARERARRLQRAAERSTFPGVSPGAAAAVVIAERSLLDGLVKYAASAPALATRVFRSAERDYDLVVWLDASPALLVERDHEHDEAILGGLVEGFRAMAMTLPEVLRVEASCPVAAIVSAIDARIESLPGDR